MKKSEIYYEAMKAVLRTDYQEDMKIEILSVLMDEKNSALYWEEREAQAAMKNQEVSADEAV